jgi:mannose-6-phosphate isomerase-like protein (cupin superfamily)
VDEPVVRQGGAGDVIASGESFCVRLKVARDEIVLTEQRLAPRAKGPPLHFHRRHSDSFYVLSARVAVRLNQEVVVVDQGGMVTVPPGVAHTFFNPDPESTSFLNIHTPGVGFDRYLVEVNAALDAGVDEEEISRIQARYDTYIVES